MPNIIYDKESNILSISFSKNKIKDSDIQQNCVVDYDSKGEIVNIDVLDIDLASVLSINKKKPLKNL